MTEIEVVKFLPTPEDPHKPSIKYYEELFKVKHINPIGRFSNLVLMMNIKTFEHVTFQSIDPNTKDDVLKKLTSKPLIGHEYILQFVEETISHENSGICWIIYENSFCSINHYLSMIKSPTNLVELFFGRDFSNKIFTENSTGLDFDCRKIFLNFFQELFHIVDSLKEMNADCLFDLDNILITDSGKLKIFPNQEDSNRKSKDTEDFVCRDNFEGFDSLFPTFNKSNLEKSDNLGYLRNLLEAGLTSVSLLFRGWSPFRLSDLSHTQRRNLNISPTQLTKCNQDVWFLQTIYDPLIRENFIRKGFSEMIMTADEELKITLESLHDVFQPQINRTLNIEKIKFLKDNSYIDSEKELFLKFLHQHYLRFFERSNELTRSRKRRFGQSFSNSVNNSGQLSMDECDPEVDNSNEGVSNWLDGGPAFQKLSQSNAFNTKDKESLCDNNLKGVSNWIDGGAAFQNVPLLKTSKSKFSTENADNNSPCGNVETLKGISNWIHSEDELKRLTDFEAVDECDCQEQDNLEFDDLMTNSDQECDQPLSKIDELSSCSSRSECGESILSKGLPTMSSFFKMISSYAKSSLASDANSIELPKNIIIFDENNPPNSTDQQCVEEQNSNIDMYRGLMRGHDLKRMIPSAKSVRLSIRNLPNPIISEHSEELCNIRYNFDSQLGGLYLNEVPEEIINDNAEDVAINSNKLPPEDQKNNKGETIMSVE